MEKYTRVEKPRPDEPINENEMRITSQGKIRSYITYASVLLQVRPSSARGPSQTASALVEPEEPIPPLLLAPLYVKSSALALFLSASINYSIFQEKKLPFIVVKAMGRAISKAVLVSEIIKVGIRIALDVSSKAPRFHILRRNAVASPFLPSSHGQGSSKIPMSSPLLLPSLSCICNPRAEAHSRLASDHFDHVHRHHRPVGASRRRAAPVSAVPLR